MRLDKATFTVFDFETTGLYPYTGDRICEIGAIQTSPGSKKVKKFHTLINPERPISRMASAINGITDDMVRDHPAISEILPSFMKFIEGSVLVAYNAGFDLGFLEAALGKNGSRLNDYYVVDALRLARRLFPWIGRYNLGTVAEALEISADGEHRALSDAYMTLKVFEKELSVLKSEGILSVDDIAYTPSRPALKTGKIKDYKSKLIEESIRDQKRLNIVYRSAWNNNITKRTITPKKIQTGYDRQYLVAYCHLKNEERNFRLEGIVTANPEDD